MTHLSSSSILLWIPRVLSLIFVAFISMFALDVFSQPQWLLALLIHLIPSFLLLVLTLVAWRYELVGMLGFSFLGLLYIVMVGLDRHWSWYVGISGPAFLVSFFYLLSFWQNKKKG